MMNKEINYEIKNWNDISADYINGSLIIGNGASIALHNRPLAKVKTTSI